MNEHYQRLAREATGAISVSETRTIQGLWSGYGEIVRCHLQHVGSEGVASVIVKHVHWPSEKNHPRGWNTNRSHERKVKSYRVETAWYGQWASSCNDECRVPQCLALETHGDEVFIVMEDLDAAGFGGRRSAVSNPEIRACIAWLANFHATFMGESPDGLWETGTYWHLDTRPDELDELDDPKLKAAAPAIDRKLSSSRFQTFVHGDAKLANFCFSDDDRVAAVDFQYVGAGCGMKDLAYFLSSCLTEDECEQQETGLLDDYFLALEAALTARGKHLDFSSLESDWRALYPLAWTDFFRFLKGWSPGHWKIHRYSERLAREVIGQL